MALNTKVALYRGTEAHLSTLASTGQQGVLALTTDTNAIFVDQGSGTAGIGNPGSGAAWIRSAPNTQVFTVASQAAMLALTTVLTGDIAVRSDVNQVFMLNSLTAGGAATLGNWIQIGIIGTGVTGLASGTAHQWVSFIDTSGVQHLTQPAFTDISGAITQTQLPASITTGTTLTVFDCGTF